jgi:hypothetical protein
VVFSVYCFFIFGLDINEARYPKKIAAAIPPAAAFVPPVNTPINPDLPTSSITPFARALPKPVSGTVAPAPANSTNFEYIPRPPKYNACSNENYKNSSRGKFCFINKNLTNYTN